MVITTNFTSICCVFKEKILKNEEHNDTVNNFIRFKIKWDKFCLFPPLSLQKKSHLRTHNTHFKFSDITKISSLCLQSLRLKLRYSPFNKYFGNSLFSFTWCGPPSSSASSSLFRKGTSLDKTKGFQGKLNEFLKVFNRMIRVAFWKFWKYY